LRKQWGGAGWNEVENGKAVAADAVPAQTDGRTGSQEASPLNAKLHAMLWRKFTPDVMHLTI